MAEKIRAHHLIVLALVERGLTVEEMALLDFKGKYTRKKDPNSKFTRRTYEWLRSLIDTNADIELVAGYPDYICSICPKRGICPSVFRPGNSYPYPERLGHITGLDTGVMERAGLSIGITYPAKFATSKIGKDLEMGRENLERLLGRKI